MAEVKEKTVGYISKGMVEVGLYLLKVHRLKIQAKAALAVIESIAALNCNELPTFDYLAMAKFLQNKISIKWPNDLLIDNKKFSGILCESKTTGKKLSV